MLSSCRGPSARGARFGAVAVPVPCGVGLGDEAPLSDGSDCEEEPAGRLGALKSLGPQDRSLTRSTCSNSSETPVNFETNVTVESSATFASRWSVLAGDFEKRDLIGFGGYGKVYSAVCRETGDDVAIKTIALPDGKQNHEIEDIEAEVALQSALEHPHILGLRGHFCEPDGRTFHLVMDLCTGGDLTDALRHHVRECRTVFPAYSGGLPNSVCERFMWQMTSAVAYLHHHRIVHRDVKPDNFLLQQPRRDCSVSQSNLRLTDFGLATRLTGGERLTRPCGTLYYRAPEVLTRSYDQLVDVWSLGVTAFAICTDHLPFGEALCTDEGDDHYVQEAARGNIWCGSEWDLHRDRTKAFVLSMLVVDVEQRPTCRRLIRENPWLKRHAPSQLGGWSTAIRRLTARP